MSLEDEAPAGAVESVETHAGSFDPALHFFAGFAVCALPQTTASSTHAATANPFADLVRSLMTYSTA